MCGLMTFGFQRKVNVTTFCKVCARAFPVSESSEKFSANFNELLRLVDIYKNSMFMYKTIMA